MEALQTQFAGVRPPSRVWRRIRREVRKRGPCPRVQRMEMRASPRFAPPPASIFLGQGEFLPGRFGLGMFLFPDAAALMTIRFGW